MMMRSLLWVTVMSLMACEGCERSEPVVDDRGGTVDAGGVTDAGVMDGGAVDAGGGLAAGDALFRRADR